MVDLLVVGAGAAGLTAGASAAALKPALSVVVAESAARPGAKILISGGGRCNITNRHVRPADFCGGPRPLIGSVLKAFPVARTLEFFSSLGVPVREEEGGRLFPASNRARTVLDALLTSCRQRGVRIVTGERVIDLRPRDGRDGFDVVTSAGTLAARAVLLACGGQSLPRSGSDGHGYAMAGRLGHGLVAPAPALVPLDVDGPFVGRLAGVTQQVDLALRIDGRTPIRASGSLLWTHRGISGPVVLDISRHWTRAAIDQRPGRLFVSMVRGGRYETIDRALLDGAAHRPRTQIRSWLAERVPEAVAESLVELTGVPGDTRLAHLEREPRRRLATLLAEMELAVRGHRGWDHAEVTSGGVPLTEVRVQTLESRIVPGLFFAGEILDVDGRLGGFNFQWAWSSGWVAAAGAVAHLGT